MQQAAPEPDRAKLVEMLRTLGVADDAIERALERGDPVASIFEAVLTPAIEQRTVSPAEIAARGGLAVEATREMTRAFGLRVPDPDEPAFTEDEAWVFTELERLVETWPPDLAIQLSRVYGRLLARIAQTEVRLFRDYVEPRIRAERDEPEAALAAIQSAFERLLPLADPLILGVHRRWLEHELAQVAVREAESGLESRLPGSVDVAFLFCDLKDFTAYVDREGDDAAVRAIDGFNATVIRERGPSFRFMKALGDGAMLVYGDAGEAVAAGARIVAAIGADGAPGVHASVHRGVAVVREGDYFGGAVNVAARLLTLAGRDEMLATRPVVDSCGAEFTWERAGAVSLRGVAGLVEVFRLNAAA
ncbi:MAG: adenylate/guanylate cyclase domain-containing protein [Solirubrobacterales bacterium]